ncbi:hypothetical protein COCON_G00207510 [Conger conger]|uniref:Uncharacterized protein n=1 Tax=Conger conger TaxID=82655 RepID=A0A9Q1HQA0_CONCO|nr:hypothetical protein COCON_G00207510 [Conger conger]
MRPPAGREWECAEVVGTGGSRAPGRLGPVGLGFGSPPGCVAAPRMHRCTVRAPHDPDPTSSPAEIRAVALPLGSPAHSPGVERGAEGGAELSVRSPCFHIVALPPCGCSPSQIYPGAPTQMPS